MLPNLTRCFKESNCGWIGLAGRMPNSCHCTPLSTNGRGHSDGGREYTFRRPFDNSWVVNETIMETVIRRALMTYNFRIVLHWWLVAFLLPRMFIQLITVINSPISFFLKVADVWPLWKELPRGRYKKNPKAYLHHPGQRMILHHPHR
jgi:hypothetical protein